MLGRQLQRCLAIDIEMQNNREEHSRKDGMEPDDVPHMAALQTLFGFTFEQLRQVKELPGAISWCRYLEDCFQPFLTDQYACLWSSIGLPRPQASSHCWTLFRAISHAATKLDDAEYSIEDVWRSVKLSLDAEGEADVAREAFHMLADTRNDECLIAVFAVLCWGSMIVQPKLTLNDAASSPCLAIHQLPADQGLKMDFVRRPIPAIFRNFHKALDRRQYTKKPMTDESTVLFVSTINYHSLRSIGKVSLKWVDTLSGHLNFDSRTRTLSVFRFPSFCALATIASDRGVFFEG